MLRNALFLKVRENRMEWEPSESESAAETEWECNELFFMMLTY